MTLRTLLIALFLAVAPACDAEVAAPCPPGSDLAVQILGSGGPIADDGRASSGYLVWIDGKSRLLVDAGGGTFLRFGEASGEVADLEFVGLSHFHTDHSADFPALLKSGFFSDRSRPLVVAGPAGDGPFPGLNDFLSSMLDADDGAYGYLSGYRDGSGGLTRLVPIEIAAETAGAIFDRKIDGREVTIDAMHVPHGIVPALAFRVVIDDVVIVFSSDQNGSDPAFVDFAKDADLLVMHMAIPEEASGTASRLHARPSKIGKIATATDAGRLVLSHFMARSLRELDGNADLVRKSFDGHMVIAEDLACISVDSGP